jgi:hypothetical protein
MRAAWVEFVFSCMFNCPHVVPAHDNAVQLGWFQTIIVPPVPLPAMVRV